MFTAFLYGVAMGLLSALVNYIFFKKIFHMPNSTSKCNTSAKDFGRRFKLKTLTRPVVEQPFKAA